ncbi:Cyclin-D1-binding protein 1 [Polyrhizophydium stewartii]|uniref:Cyclin-D1-binding protein 1 n=1 Tax=Polyrhizophydium stewartii TaxID=2732419 RepID=A0ABR4MW58_9FUNG|nr:hypothetical protein HK105_001398 [Polyrhizophydium stewartii]
MSSDHLVELRTALAASLELLHAGAGASARAAGGQISRDTAAADALLSGSVVDLANIQPTLSALAKMVSHQTTMLTIAARAGDAKETRHACGRIADCVGKLVATVHTLPSAIGASLSAKVAGAADNLIRGIQQLVESSLAETPAGPAARPAPARLSSNSAAGNAWSACTDIEQLPLSNSLVVAELLELRAEQLTDAIDECAELVESASADKDDHDDDDDDDEAKEGSDGWDELIGERGEGTRCTQEDQEWIRGAQTMIKTVKLTIKKLASVLRAAKTHSHKTNTAMDGLAKFADRCVEAADELVGNIDLPVADNAASLTSAVAEVVEAETRLLDAAESLLADLDALQSQTHNHPWLGMCTRQMAQLTSKLAFPEK